MVLHGVRVVVDVHLVDDVRIERIEVRPAIRILERDHVRDQRHHRRLVVVDKGVQVGVVCDGVLRDQWSLMVTRSLSRQHGVGHEYPAQSRVNDLRISHLRCTSEQLVSERFYDALGAADFAKS